MSPATPHRVSPHVAIEVGARESPRRCHQTPSPRGCVRWCGLGDTRVSGVALLAHGRLWDQTLAHPEWPGVVLGGIRLVAGRARAGGALGGWGSGRARLGHPWAPLSIQKLGGNTSTGGLLRDFGMRSSPGNASHHRPWTRMGTSVLLQRGAGRGHQVGALLSHGSRSPRGLGTRRGLRSHGSEALPRSRWSDTGGASRPSVNYLASMFINQQFLCKQTHPEPLLPVTLATAPSRPWLGMCSGPPPGPQPRLQLFACSLLLLQGVFRPLRLPSVGSWASLLRDPGPPHH